MIKRLVNNLKKKTIPEVEVDLTKISKEQLVRYLTRYQTKQIYSDSEVTEFESIVAQYGIKKIFDYIVFFKFQGCDPSTSLLVSVRRDTLDSLMNDIQEYCEKLTNNEVFQITREAVYLRILPS